MSGERKPDVPGLLLEGHFDVSRNLPAADPLTMTPMILQVVLIKPYDVTREGNSIPASRTSRPPSVHKADSTMAHARAWRNDHLWSFLHSSVRMPEKPQFSSSIS